MPIRASQVNEYLQTARDVIDAVGGSDNVLASDVCMTRLRLSLEDASRVDIDHLNTVRCVLGVTRRSENGYDVIFGPSVIDGVYRDFVELSGTGKPRCPSMAASPASRSRPLSVTISPASQRREPSRLAASGVASATALPRQDERSDELSDLIDAVASVEERSASWSDPDAKGRRVLVINGPNINLLGIREPGIYGTDSYEDLVALCRSAAKEAGFESCRCYQSNHEGDLVDEIQDAMGVYDGIVMNPAAYTHTSVALLDALKAVRIPCVEVHISKVEEREGFRQVSYVREACFETITGLGLEGYRKAIFDLAEHLDRTNA